MTMTLNDYSPKIRARAKKLASKLYDPASLELDRPENQKSRTEIEAVLVMYCEAARNDLTSAAAEAEEAFRRAKQAAVDAARALEDAAAEVGASEQGGAESDEDED